MDLIDRQALLKQIDIDSDGEPGYYGDTWKFIDTIKSMPSATDTNVGTKLGTNLAEVGMDCISRKAAISAICNACGKIDCDKMDKCEKLQLPPANCSEFPNNSDTISRKQAINALSTITMYKGSIPFGTAVMRIEQLPSAEPGWIPVTEKPIKGGQYIVTLKDDKEVWTDIAEWNPTFGGRWQAEFFDCEYRDIDNVVAWQPLPTPYREGGQDEPKKRTMQKDLQNLGRCSSQQTNGKRFAYCCGSTCV